MSNLQRYDNDGIELIIDTVTGESFASVSGYARMVSLSQQAISKRITHNQIELKTAEIHTTTGLKTVNLITESLICEWLPKDNPEMATKLMQLGVRVFLHQVAGFTVSTTAVTPEPISDKLFAKQFLDSLWGDIKQSYPEIDPRLIDGAKMNGLIRHYPEFSNEFVEVKKLISATSKEESLPVSPTELGVKFFETHPELGKAPSGQKVNLALTLLELQEKSNDKICPYRLTSTGEEYGELQIETCKGHNKTVYRVRWHLEVLDLIEDTLLTLSRTQTKGLVH